MSKGNFVLLWLFNQAWGITSIPSHVLLIHLHPQKLGQSHRAQTIHLSFVQMVLLFFSVKCTEQCSFHFYNEKCLSRGQGTAKNGLQCTMCDWVFLLYENTFCQYDYALAVNEQKSLQWVWPALVSKKQWKAALIHKTLHFSQPSHPLYKCHWACT